MILIIRCLLPPLQVVSAIPSSVDINESDDDGGGGGDDDVQVQQNGVRRISTERYTAILNDHRLEKKFFHEFLTKCGIEYRTQDTKAILIGYVLSKFSTFEEFYAKAQEFGMIGTRDIIITSTPSAEVVPVVVATENDSV